MDRRQLFLNQVAQTSSMPLCFEIDRAEGIFLYDSTGKKYFDMNSGIAVSSLGHCHPKVVEAISQQSKKYLHTMVYGEHIQQPQIDFANQLLRLLDTHFQCIYYLMTGTEATELAVKVLRKHTARHEIIAARNAYHGSTIGAESLRSDLDYVAPFAPLVPGVRHIEFNNLNDLDHITTKTAGVIIEAVQGEAGVYPADMEYLSALRQKCIDTGSLLVIDEIQSGFGRTGHLFAHQNYGVIPDLLLVGKAMGGGMPIAGVISSRKIMQSMIQNPTLGHITTFGGHPVSCAAAAAALRVLTDEGLISQVKEKEKIVHHKLKHPIVKEIRSAGLMMAVELTKRKYLKHTVSHAHELGVLVDWFLFNNRSFRLAPPLIASSNQLEEACDLLLRAMDYAQSQYRH